MEPVRSESRRLESMRLRDLAAELGAELLGDGDVMITGFAGLDTAGPGDLTFLAKKELAAQLATSQATAVIVGPGVVPDRPALRVDQPYHVFARLLARLEADPDRVFPRGIHPTAVIDPTADVAQAAAIGPYCVIGAGTVVGRGSRLAAHVVLGPDVTVGCDCRFYPQVCIREYCRVGDRVVLQPGCLVGNDGFGYLAGPQGLQKVPQVGIVVLEDDVELGAGTCVDRATIGETVIGRGSKLDNLVQIGHNVSIGAHGAISAQTGISGSCRIGDRVTMGGQVGIADHLTIGSNVKVGAKSGLHKDVADGSVLFGYPALDARESFRIAGALRKLPDMVRTLAQLQRTVGELADGQADIGGRED